MYRAHHHLGFALGTLVFAVRNPFQFLQFSEITLPFTGAPVWPAAQVMFVTVASVLSSHPFCAISLQTWHLGSLAGTELESLSEKAGSQRILAHHFQNHNKKHVRGSSCLPLQDAFISAFWKEAKSVSSSGLCVWNQNASAHPPTSGESQSRGGNCCCPGAGTDSHCRGGERGQMR